MNTKTINNEKVKDTGICWWMVAIWAGILACLAMLPTMLQYRGLFAVRGDFSQLFIPTMIEFKRMLTTGAPWWSPGLGLGTGFGGLVSGSPFYWLLMAVPKGVLPHAIGLSALLRLMAASCFSFFALRLFVTGRNAAIGALLYTFSGFTIINSQFLVYADVVALFPLLVLGVEWILRGHRYAFGMLSMAVAFNVFTSFYMFAAETLFMLMYIAFRIHGDKNLPNRIALLAKIAGGFVLGIALSSVILLPKVLAIFECSRAAAVSYTKKQWLFFEPQRYLELIRVFFMPSEGMVKHAFYPNTESWTSTGIHLPVFGMALVLAYLMRYKNWLSRLLLVCFAASLVPLLNGAFSGLTNPVYTRWWFALAFLLALATAFVLDQKPKIERGLLRKCFLTSLLICAALTVPFAMFVFWPGALWKLRHIVPQKALLWYGPPENDPFMGGPNLVLISWLLCAVNYTLLWLVLFHRRGEQLITACISVAIIANFAVFLELNNSDVINTVGPQTKPTDLRYHIDRTITNPAYVNLENRYNWRIDYPHEIRNYGLYSNHPSPNMFWSIRSKHIAKFGEMTGCGSATAVNFLMPYDRPALRALFSVKHFVNYDPQGIKFQMPGFDLEDKRPGADIYVNENYIPMGFSYDTYVREADISQYSSSIERLMLKAVVLTDDQISRYGSKLSPFAGSPAELEGELWMTDAKNMRKHTCKNYTADSKGFSAEIELKEPRVVFFSIPYGNGWSAQVNGKPIAIERVNTGFLGLMLAEGQHDITFRYFPPGLRAGAKVSAISLIMLLGYFVIAKRRFGPQDHK